MRAANDLNMGTSGGKKGKTSVVSGKKEKANTIVLTDDYFEIENPNEDLSEKLDVGKEPRTIEKVVFVLTTAVLVLITHGITGAQWMLPYMYAILTPILLAIRAVCYWKYNWQYFMIDFCYFANALLYVSIWLPNGRELTLVAFALSNGPVLVAAAVYRNSLVYHHYDKVTSCYIHFLPAFLTFCIRWYPETTSKFWISPFGAQNAGFHMMWLFVAPFVFYILHAVLYMLIVNVVMRPKDPYVTSYSYLAEKFDKLNCIGGPWGQGLAYYGLSLVFCLISLIPSLIAYNYFPVHCALIALVFLVVVWNGASYYVHIFSKRGFTME